MTEQTATGDTADTETMSFEAALAALEEIVQRLESGQVPLEESIELYSRGQHLKALCEARLNAAQAKIEQLTLSEEGVPQGRSPFQEG